MSCRAEEYRSVYSRWKNMKGNRDPEWDDFESFIRDMGIPEVPSALLRQDKNAPFGRDNCEWVPKTEAYIGANNSNFKNKLVSYTCEFCSSTFTGREYAGRPNKFCSIACHNAAQKKAKLCAHCGKPFIYETHRFEKFCSLDCAFTDTLFRASLEEPKREPKFKRGAPRTKQACIICGSIMLLRPSDVAKGRKCCSRACYGKLVGLRQQGDKHHNWKGGITVHVDRIRKHAMYKEWRSEVFKRDEYTCQTCCSVGGELRAHHIEAYSEEPKKRLRVSNGVTLCARCHREWHVFNRKGLFEGKESSLQTQANDMFREAGFFVFNTHGHGMQASGIPDSILCFCGKFAGVEYKVYPNYLSPLQKLQMKAIKATGGLYYVVRSVDEVPRIIDELREIVGL